MRGYAHVIKEDRLNPNILYPRHRVRPLRQRRRRPQLGPVQAEQLPDGLAVRDIALQERDDDLVLATHGRGIWVIDDVSPLRR